MASELRSGGAEVRAFCRSEPPGHAGVSDWVRGDVRDRAAVEWAVSGCDAVVHTAALYSYRRADAPLMEAVNVEGTRHVIEACLHEGVRSLLVTSSSATCGPVAGRAASEQDEPPRLELAVPYKRTKLAAERLALSAARGGGEGDGLDVTCVNPTTVVGPFDNHPTPSGKMILDLVEGRVHAYIWGSGLNVVAVEDVAKGHALALANGRSGHRYILGGENLSLRDVFALTLSAVGLKPPRLAIPWSLVYAAAWASRLALRVARREPNLLVLDEVRLARLPLFFSSDKARRELGYKWRPAGDALADAARWFASARGDRGVAGTMTSAP